MVLRAVVGQSLLTFMPALFVQKGFSMGTAGTIYVLFLASGTVSCLLSTLISGRAGFTSVCIFSFLFMTLARWLLLQLNGSREYSGAALAGGFVLNLLPPGVTVVQAPTPKEPCRRSVEHWRVLIILAVLHLVVARSLQENGLRYNRKESF